MKFFEHPVSKQFGNTLTFTYEKQNKTNKTGMSTLIKSYSAKQHILF